MAFKRLLGEVAYMQVGCQALQTHSRFRQRFVNLDIPVHPGLCENKMS